MSEKPLWFCRKFFLPLCMDVCQELINGSVWNYYPCSKCGTIYRYDWCRILFSPSIYRIEEVDQISPYRNCVILVFVCLVLWPLRLAIHYYALWQIIIFKAIHACVHVCRFTILASGLSRLVEIHRIQYKSRLSS